MTTLTYPSRYESETKDYRPGRIGRNEWRGAGIRPCLRCSATVWPETRYPLRAPRRRQNQRSVVARSGSKVWGSLDRSRQRPRVHPLADEGGLSGPVARTAAMNLKDILARLKGARQSGEGWAALCPSH